MHDESATPIDAVALLSASPSAFSAASPSPRSAAAPTLFSTISVPATPRRPVVQVEFSTATSSLTITLALSRSSISAATWKFIMSPE